MGEHLIYKKANIHFLSAYSGRTLVQMSMYVNKELVQVQSSLHDEISVDLQLEEIYKVLINTVNKYLKE